MSVRWSLPRAGRVVRSQPSILIPPTGTGGGPPRGQGRHGALGCSTIISRVPARTSPILQGCRLSRWPLWDITHDHVTSNNAPVDFQPDDQWSVFDLRNQTLANATQNIPQWLPGCQRAPTGEANSQWESYASRQIGIPILLESLDQVEGGRQGSDDRDSL